MNTIDVHHGITILGWTLIHSFWQGLLIVLLYSALRRMLPPASPAFNYAMSTAALFLVVLSAIITSILLFIDTPALSPAIAETTPAKWTLLTTTPWREAPLTWLSVPIAWIDNHLSLLVNGWLAGMLFFGLRLALTGSQTVRLRRNAQPVVGFWEARLLELAGQLGIRKAILLAESGGVDAPVLLGCLRPMILMPIGMLSGLSTDQVEAILLHELAHIRRHDFALNFIQSLIEVILFFNPFVWILSSHIRSDREQCCDDVVVTMKSPLTYARALHQLAEARTLGTSFSLGAAGTKNKLLDRIKRIMRTSEKKEERRGKVLPVVVIMMALTAASWLSIQAYQPEGTDSPKAFALSDTLKNDLEDHATSIHRRTISTVDENGVPHTEIIELTTDDLAEEGIGMTNFEVPPLPEIEAEMAIPELAEMDTLPRLEEWSSGPDREEWEKEFTEKFRERFTDFYEKNQPELEKILEEVQIKLSQVDVVIHNEQVQSINKRLESEMQRVEEQIKQLEPQQEVLRAQAEAMDRINEKVHATLKMHEAQIQSVERSMKAFERELKEQLIKDGYLGKEEKIGSMNWDDNGSMTINGKKIKAADKGKYKKLQDSYFKEGSRIGVAE